MRQGSSTAPNQPAPTRQPALSTAAPTGAGVTTRRRVSDLAFAPWQVENTISQRERGLVR